MLFSKKQSEIYKKHYRARSQRFNASQRILKSIGKIPYAKDFDEDIKKTLRDKKLRYYIINEIQKEENKLTYLLTFTGSDGIDDKLRKFVSKLNYLKSLKGFQGLAFDYFSIIEPKRSGDAHLHIKLVIDKRKGISTAVRKIMSNLDFEFKNIKRQGIDKKAYLLKTLTEKNYQEYVMWINEKGISLKKSIRCSRYIKINDDIKITLKEYKNSLRVLLKRNPKGYIGLKEVREYILNMSILFLIIKELKKVKESVKKNYKSKKTLYKYIYQVAVLSFVLKFIDVKNNSPTVYCYCMKK